jgi:hypothetical protein
MSVLDEETKGCIFSIPFVSLDEETKGYSYLYHFLYAKTFAYIRSLNPMSEMQQDDHLPPPCHR